MFHCRFYSVPGKSRSDPFPQILHIAAGVTSNIPYGGLAGHSGNCFLSISCMFPVLPVGMLMLVMLPLRRASCRPQQQ